MNGGEIKKEDWNRFILENNGLFLQSWEWGEFQKVLGRKIWRLGDCKEWAALVIKYNLPLGKNYLYCPGGPVLNLNHIAFSLQMRGDAPPSAGQRGAEGKHDITSPQSPPPCPPSLRSGAGRRELRRGGMDDIIEKFLNTMKNIAKQENSIFLKIEPFWIKIHPSPPLEKERVSPFGKGRRGGIFQKSDGGQRILETLVLDLNKTEEELLAGMKQKTRYNINLSRKQGVSVKAISNFQFPISKNCLAEFLKLIKITAERDKIKSHPENHYRKMVEIIPNDIFRLYVAEFDRKIIAANIIAFFGKRATYLHGASSNESRNLMAPYLLQWEQIKEAKKRGCKIYDFWGIDEKKWPGITRFKKGFGGDEISYVGTYDYIFDRKWYWAYKLAKQISNF